MALIYRALFYGPHFLPISDLAPRLNITIYILFILRAFYSLRVSTTVFFSFLVYYFAFIFAESGYFIILYVPVEGVAPAPSFSSLAASAATAVLDLIDWP